MDGINRITFPYPVTILLLSNVCALITSVIPITIFICIVYILDCPFLNFFKPEVRGLSRSGQSINNKKIKVSKVQSDAWQQGQSIRSRHKVGLQVICLMQILFL